MPQTILNTTNATSAAILSILHFHLSPSFYRSSRPPTSFDLSQPAVFACQYQDHGTRLLRLPFRSSPSQTPTSRAHSTVMPSLQNLSFVSILLVLLISIVSAKPSHHREKEHAHVGDVDQLLQLLDQIEPPALHAALHDFSPKKFKQATSIVSLAKRLGSAGNSSSIGQYLPPSTITSPSTTTAVPAVASPVSAVTKTGSSNVAPAPVGPATATTETSVPAGSRTTTVAVSTSVLVASTLHSSSTPAAGGASPASLAATSGSTKASSSGGSVAASTVLTLVTSTNAAGVTMVSTVGGGAATFGSIVTITDARGLTLVSTIGGGVVTIQPSGSQAASASSAAAASASSSAAAASQSSSAAPQSSYTSVVILATTLPGGGQATITSTVVAAATPSGTVGAKTGSSTTATPGLQSGGAVESRRVGWELAGLVGGAVGVAMVL
ncbi:MAG: hypothetical protein FRX48_07517 [Lasallia pustulata]|uniref:Uncharacterized protein n=1 Tax=Lasallia pustulata TaxID=136370 RepID=A0A5M8PGK1_9LECA|nr:MAG: hypothetical protein FRX48_07517 [Lasallia pustulata]